jgi:hypothetical protein
LVFRLELLPSFLIFGRGLLFPLPNSIQWVKTPASWCFFPTAVGRFGANEKVICADCGLGKGITRVGSRAADYRQLFTGSGLQAADYGKVT